MASPGMWDLSRNFISMISIDECIAIFTQPKNSAPTQPEPKQPSHSDGLNVPPCDMQTFSGNFKS